MTEYFSIQDKLLSYILALNGAMTQRAKHQHSKLDYVFVGKTILNLKGECPH